MDNNLVPLETNELEVASVAESHSLPTINCGIPNDAFRAFPITPAEEGWRHGCWRSRRRKVWDVLVRIHKSAARLDAFANCGSACTAEKSPAGDEIRIVGSCCHDRFCIPCGTERSERIARTLQRHCEGRRLRFLTLTLKHRVHPLRDEISRLLRCFRLLRRTALWKSAISGGAYFLEIKLGRATGCWHVHVHLLVEGKSISQANLAAEWKRITGDSFIVDVRGVPNCSHVVRYVTKYVGKPVDSSVYEDTDRLEEYILACQGVRFCGAYGKWRGLRLEALKSPDVKWEKLGLVTSIIARVREGDERAFDLLVALRRKYFWLPDPTTLSRPESDPP